MEEGYMKLENYFVDRTTEEANVNRHKMVWAKSRAKYEQRLREKVKELLKEIEAVIEAKNQEYGDKDLEEMGGGGGLTSVRLEKKIELPPGVRVSEFKLWPVNGMATRFYPKYWSPEQTQIGTKANDFI